ncbi:hypothetical protein ACFX1T_010145 [Malus domestica]
MALSGYFNIVACQLPSEGILGSTGYWSAFAMRNPAKLLPWRILKEVWLISTGRLTGVGRIMTNLKPTNPLEDSNGATRQWWSSKALCWCEDTLLTIMALLITNQGQSLSLASFLMLIFAFCSSKAFCSRQLYGDNKIIVVRHEEWMAQHGRAL